jgi:hypothetical protein
VVWSRGYLLLSVQKKDTINTNKTIMREYPLTAKQIEICNYFFSINHQNINRDKLKSDGHNESDIS